MRKVLLAAILLLSTELWLFLWLIRQIGWWPMVASTLLAGILGASLAKRQGRRVFREWQAALGSGRPPAIGALEGTLVVVSGALFLLPGVLSDVLGLLLLFAPVRRRVAEYLRPLLGIDSWTRGFSAQRAARDSGRGSQVLDTEGETVEADEDEEMEADEEDTGPRQLH
ncbi:MAG: FxsA family protein [Deltaproteobacteria bacterium]